MDETKFKGKYRIPSARKVGWDYASNAAYFITICTANRTAILGAVHNGQMELSSMGEIVREEWEKSFAMRRELFCDAYVIMPNHIHAIVRIDNETPAVETHGHASEPDQRHGVARRAPKSVSSFVAGFKSTATKRINQLRQMPGVPVWQARFHDHIIRNEDEYRRIAAYVENNPIHWAEDKFYVP